MLNENVKWFFPESTDEAINYLKDNESYSFHSGGTAILRLKSKNIKGFIDLGKLDLKYIKDEKDKISIGAMTTFSEIISNNIEAKSYKMLQKALAPAASTPLRNRISMGGSIIDSPIWSDLWSTLLSLNAKIVYINLKGEENLIDAEEFIKKGIKKEKILIKEISIDKKEVNFFVKRMVRVNFDYPVFNLACAIDENSENCRIFVTGIKSLYKRLENIERIFENEKKFTENVKNEIEKIELEFHDDFKGSGEYKKQVLKAFLEDGLKELTGDMS